MQVMQYFITGLFLAIVFLDNVRAMPAEPVCSKFDYEMKTLEAMLRIENRAEKMMEELKSVRDSMTKELDEIKNLKAEVERQQTAMESKFTALKSEVEEVPEKMTEEMQSLRDEAKRQRTATESKITALKSEVDEKLVPGEVIAFSVTHPTKQLVNGTPIFSIVITNIGNAYDVSTGIFTCPVSGLYTFVFTVASGGKYDVYCWIRHNGSDKVYGRSYSDNSYTSASASVNLLLQKGDSVTLGSCTRWKHVSLSSMVTFSGALVQGTERKN